MGLHVRSVVDAIGDAGGQLADGAGRTAGALVGGGARLVGAGLDRAGLHAAADRVADAGDRIADVLGAHVAEGRLGDCDEPAELLHGDAGRIRTAAAHLARFAAAFDTGRDGLVRLDPGDWNGAGADAFRAAFTAQPVKWARAATACQDAARALEAYASTVDWARGQAAEAVRLWQQGPAAAPAARDTLASARTQRDTAGCEAATALRAATELAPAAPDFADRLLHDGSDLAKALPLAAEHFAGGVVRSATDLVRFARGLNPLDPYNLTHPYAYVTHLDTTAAGLTALRVHPERLPGLLLGTGWGSDGAEAGGRLLGNLLMVVATGGGSTAARATAETAAGAAGAAGRRAAAAAAAKAPWRDALPGRGTAQLDDIRASLRGGPDGLAPVDPADQRMLEAHVPRLPDGSFARHPDPAASWTQLQNDGGSTVAGRANNCADGVRAALETWYGNPQVAAARTASEGPERAVDENLVAWAGKDNEYAGAGPAAYDRVAHKLVQAGHGASAMVTVSWPGERFGHVFTALNHRGRVVWYDPQSGQVDVRPIHTDVNHVWDTVLGPDRSPL